MPNKLTQFQKPTIDQVEAYFREIGVEPAKATAETFYWHYESNGWMVGRTKMASWKGACQTWKRSPYRTQGTLGRNNAPTGQATRKITYVTASAEQGTPMPEELKTDLFSKIGGLVSKFTGKKD